MHKKFNQYQPLGKPVAFPPQAKWISNTSIRWPKAESPVPLVFRRAIHINKTLLSAQLLCTALGIYEVELDGEKLGDAYFAPGFTSYKHQLQCQQYDLTAKVKEGSLLQFTLAGGWAVGTFNYNRKSRIATDYPALMAAVTLKYTDGSVDILCTDEQWQVTEEGPVRAASWYDGEVYDATITLASAVWKSADIVVPRCKPTFLTQYGPPVTVWRTLQPMKITQAPSGEWIYDMGQNFAGVIAVKLQGHQGQTVVFRHTEILSEGELYTEPLRTARQTVTYICREGEQTYSPHFTYMGFRFVGVRGIEPEALSLEGLALSSLLDENGVFECSNSLLNKLNENVRWGARANFVEIPTDCPQRDERLGWTGDIAIFARTACWNYNMGSFLGKWIQDVTAEQGKSGSIPLVVPENGYEWPSFTTACWGDCCILVPWAEYQARGDVELLRRTYPTMKRFLASVKRWAAKFSVGDQRYIWKLPFQFGDWCAPEGDLKQWMRKGPWIATAYWANSCRIVAEVAELLGDLEEAKKLHSLREKITDAYRTVFTDGHGKLLEEFQTAYVLPLYFDMVEGEEAKQMADHLARLVTEAGNKLTTGFPSTPFLLFALSDHGHLDKAYDVLFQEDFPSWLYEIRSGATTVWERWDAVLKNAEPNLEAVGSLNHYAYGAVADWLYRRVLGIETISAGYKHFRFAPMPGGGLQWAKGSVGTPFGKISAAWNIEGERFSMDVQVPADTICEVRLPDAHEETLSAGSHHLKCFLPHKGIDG